MLQQRGYYTIKLGDGKQIPLRFCTWSLMRFCELNKTVDESGKLVPMTLFELQTELTSGMTLKGVSSLLLCASEWICIQDKKEFTYTEIDATDWIDELGGIASDEFLELIKVIISSFSDKGQKEEEKKIPKKVKS